MNIIPLLDRVVLSPIQKESVTSSGIILPDGSSKQRPFIYSVVAIGPGKPDTDMGSIKVWDQVLCGQYSGDEITLDNETFKIVAIEYILGKINS